MRLTDPWFGAEFYGEVGADGHRGLPSIEGAQGLFLWCPCGYGKAQYPLGGERPHGVMVPFSNPRNAPALPPDHGPCSSQDPNHHPRWSMTGTGLDDLSTQPSVAVGKPQCWHGYITNGEVT